MWGKDEDERFGSEKYVFCTEEMFEKRGSGELLDGDGLEHDLKLLLKPVKMPLEKLNVRK